MSRLLKGVGIVVLAVLAACVVLAAGIRGGVVSAAWVSRLPLAERLITRWVPPDAPVAADGAAGLTADERKAAAALGARLDAVVLWSSNRSGNHELYELDLRRGTLRKLTDHPHVEFFSRYSPDGSQILFLRSQRPWVSFREMTAWDLYVMNRDGSNVRRIAVEAYTPSWSPDGRRITFTRRNTVVEVDLASGAERVIHDGTQAPTSSEVPEVEPGPDGLLALSRRGVRNPSVGVADLAAKHYEAISSGRACQIAWVPGEKAVYWVDPTGHGGTRIMMRALGAPEGTVLMDLPGEFSHEYFPRLSRDGRWLVWGASAGGHEHDRADYEIFVWERGTPWESAVRLTHSPGNDQWPDILIR
ncbi:MAG TPA: hypothetical protein VIL35_08785 [Vicinamibacterales bacterium]